MRSSHEVGSTIDEAPIAVVLTAERLCVKYSSILLMLYILQSGVLNYSTAAAAALLVLPTVIPIYCCTRTLLVLQPRSGDNWGQITWNLSALSPKRDWSSKGVKYNSYVTVVPGSCCVGRLRVSTGLCRWWPYTLPVLSTQTTSPSGCCHPAVHPPVHLVRHLCTLLFALCSLLSALYAAQCTLKRGAGLPCWRSLLVSATNEDIK